MTCLSCKQELEVDAKFCGHCGRRTRRRCDSMIGSLVDDTYRIDEKLASGGFGAIYRATHIPSGTVLALKVLHADFAGQPALAGRFLRESKALAQLRNRHTIVTYERGEARDGTLYIAMELLRGESLQARLARCGTLGWKSVLAIMRAVCSSLAEAHAHGIIHRDLKPANIFLCAGDFVKVLDFGVAKVLPWSAIDDGAELTLAGQAVGTLEYMAPEQLSGGVCDARTDIYALGVVAYEMLTGRRPYADATNAASLITALFTQNPQAPSMLGKVPAGVDELVLRCLERECADRYASVDELAAVLDRMLATAPLPTSHGGMRSFGGLQIVETRTLPLTILGTLPERTSQMPAFDIDVRGTAIDVQPAHDQGVRWWLVALVVAALAIAWAASP